MRFCARWRQRPIAASATTAARLTSSCASPISKGCSGGGDSLRAVVIAGAAKQSPRGEGAFPARDCFVALAPRNDGESGRRPHKHQPRRAVAALIEERETRRLQQLLLR